MSFLERVGGLTRVRSHNAALLPSLVVLQPLTLRAYADSRTAKGRSFSVTTAKGDLSGEPGAKIDYGRWMAWFTTPRVG